MTAQAWRQAGLVRTRTFLVGTPATVWLAADGLAVAGLPWRPYEPTVAHRHAAGLVRAEAETMPGITWVCERELRESVGGRPLHPPDGVVEVFRGLGSFVTRGEDFGLYPERRSVEMIGTSGPDPCAGGKSGHLSREVDMRHPTVAPVLVTLASGHRQSDRP